MVGMRTHFSHERDKQPPQVPIEMQASMAARIVTQTKAYHDVGGEDFGPVPTDDGAYQLWERRVDAMMRLLSSPQVGLMRVDELRRGIETLGEAAYNAEPYYGKWARSLAKIMIEKGVLTQDELDAKIAALRVERTIEP